MLNFFILLFALNHLHLLDTKERTAISSALARKAQLFWEAFNEMEGVTCNKVSSH